MNSPELTEDPLRETNISPSSPPIPYVTGMERLVETVQELSLARSLDDVMRIVRLAARELTGADGATFVLRDGDHCYYAEENALEPLWKGQRFPMATCISGWVMLNAQTAVIPDIYVDPRIPHDAYRPTFVKSLVMAPIRKETPIAAIGNYWAHCHTPNPEAVKLLESLAHTTAVAMENVQLLTALSQSIESLKLSNKTLEDFALIASHDLQEPLRKMMVFSGALEKEAGATLSDDGRHYLHRIQGAAERMRNLVLALVDYSRITPILDKSRFNALSLNGILEEVLQEVDPLIQAAQATVSVGVLATVEGDAYQLKQLFKQLIENALKFHQPGNPPKIDITGHAQAENHPDAGHYEIVVADEGIGFNPEYAQRIFTLFQQLHQRGTYTGTGAGLALCRKIVENHQGQIFAESQPDKGSRFYIRLPIRQQSDQVLPISEDIRPT